MMIDNVDYKKSLLVIIIIHRLVIFGGRGEDTLFCVDTNSERYI